MRTKGSKAKKAAKATKAAKSPASGPSNAADLIDKAHTLLAQSDFELAIRFLQRAVELEPSHLEARELLGVAELEGGDAAAGREHLLRLLPPHAEAPTHPSPYLYLAQTAGDPHEALGYYSTAASMIERSGQLDDVEMAVTALVAMVEIWMSDLCFEPAASDNCDALIARALALAPEHPDARLSLASIRMSQSNFDEARRVILGLHQEIDDESKTIPPLPTRLLLSRLLLEHNLHAEALDVVGTIREEDALEVEGAYLEGWAWHLRGEALESGNAAAEEIVATGDDEEPLTAAECYAESMRALIECAKLFAEQDYPDEGIGAHVNELLQGLQARGVQPAVDEDDEAGAGAGQDGEGWEDVDDDVEMS